MKKTLHVTIKIAIVSLLHKKNERYLLKNFRPISLTNYDYKIIAFALPYRLQRVITNLVSKNQSGYIKTRYFIALIHPIQWTIALSVSTTGPAKRQKRTSCIYY